jgi:phosphohistidine phosphatase
MDLLIVRHAIAHERDPARWHDDALRPLSPAGIRRARKAAAGLKELTPRPRRLLSSPLVRARETAKILTQVAGWPEAEDVPELSPGEPALAVLTLLAADHNKAARSSHLKDRDQMLAVVGHQPGLGELLAACLLGAGATLRIEMKKNAVACVAFAGKPRAGHAVLKWLATPKMLRALR